MRVKSTHCLRGHERNSDNTYTTPKGVNQCRPCLNILQMRNIDKKHFGGNREITIQRDGEKCVTCGMTRTEHRERFRRDITVDHIDDNGLNKPVELKNNSLDNLQTLCIQCHARKDNRENKLTNIQVINIRHIRYEINRTALARLYGVSDTYINMLLAGEWRNNITMENIDQ